MATPHKNGRAVRRGAGQLRRQRREVAERTVQDHPADGVVA